MPTIKPALPEIHQALTKAKMDPKILNECKHWSCELKPGERKVIEGVIVTKLEDGIPNSSVSKPLFAGVPEDEQPKFDIEPIEVTDTKSMEAYHKKQEQLVRWYAKYWGKFLSEEKRSKYEHLMLDTYDETWKILKPVAEETWNKKTGIDFAGIRAQLADRMSKHLMSELQIFDGNNNATQRRYGKSTTSNKTLTKNELKDTLEAMLSGAFLKREEKKSIASPTLSMPLPIMDIRSTTTTPGLFGGRVDFAELAYPHIYKTYEYLGEPVVGGAEARVFVFTHEVADLPFAMPLHTSIVVGVWTIERQMCKVRTWKQDAQSSTTGSPTLPNIIEQKTVIVTRARFLNWDLANGCAGSYPRGDLQTTVAITTFSGNDLPTTLDRLRKWVFGCTPTLTGKRYPMRAVSYSVGLYGTDWVCHNCANAFAFYKWNFIPVDSPFITWHGLFGDKGISSRKDIWGGIHKGCVPGKECYYTVAPPYVEPLAAQIVNVFCTGEAHNLDIYWDGADWKDTKAKYNEKNVANTGYDYTISVTP